MMCLERLWQHLKKDIQALWIFNLLSPAIFLQFRHGISNTTQFSVDSGWNVLGVWWQCFQKQTASSLERIDGDCISRAHVSFWEYIWIMHYFQLFSFNFLWYWQHCFGVLILLAMKFTRITTKYAVLITASIYQINCHAIFDVTQLMLQCSMNRGQIPIILS